VRCLRADTETPFPRIENSLHYSAFQTGHGSDSDAGFYVR
jgi:hypothetical protein